MDEKLKRLVTKCCGIFHIPLKETMIDSLTQFIKFGVVGVTNTIISYVLNILVLFIMSPFGISWDYIIGNTVAFLLSVLWSFYWNNRFVFKVKEGEKRSIVRALLKTYIAYGFTGIILNNILSSIWVSVLGISKFIAPLINLIISVPLNFVINKLWAFKVESKCE